MNTWATHAYDKDGSEINPDYGVPTGVVPRVPVNITLPKPHTPVAELEHDLLAPEPEPGPMKGLSGRYAGPIQRAIDDFFLMERKAQAWDLLRGLMKPDADRMMLALMDELLKPRP